MLPVVMIWMLNLTIRVRLSNIVLKLFNNNGVYLLELYVGIFKQDVREAYA